MSGELQVHSKVALLINTFRINLEGVLAWAREFQRKQPQENSELEKSFE